MSETHIGINDSIGAVYINTEMDDTVVIEISNNILNKNCSVYIEVDSDDLALMYNTPSLVAAPCVFTMNTNDTLKEFRNSYVSIGKQNIIIKFEEDIFLFIVDDKYMKKIHGVMEIIAMRNLIKGL